MSSSATSTAPVRPHRDVARLALPRLAWGIAIAVVVNLIVFGIASFAGASMLAGDRGVSWILVVITTVGAMVAGAIVTGLLARWRGGAIRVMAWVGLVFGLVTAPSPIVVAGDATTAIALASMHVLTGVIWFLAIRPRIASAA